MLENLLYEGKLPCERRNLKHASRPTYNMVIAEHATPILFPSSLCIYYCGLNLEYLNARQFLMEYFPGTDPLPPNQVITPSTLLHERANCPVRCTSIQPTDSLFFNWAYGLGGKSQGLLLWAWEDQFGSCCPPDTTCCGSGCCRSSDSCNEASGAQCCDGGGVCTEGNCCENGTQYCWRIS